MLRKKPKKLTFTFNVLVVAGRFWVGLGFCGAFGVCFGVFCCVSQSLTLIFKQLESAFPAIV